MIAQSNDQDRTRLTLSVAMCTYNGGLYLLEQLTSIAEQTRLPDEIIVCDDGSTDDTLQILIKFQENAPFPVKIHQNERNLGPTKNFERAIALCNGKAIVLSDQDDVWMPDKLEKIELALKDHPEAGYVFSDALVTNEMLFSLGYTMWEHISFTSYKRSCFEQGNQLNVLLEHNVVTGATMAFRKELRDLFLPIPSQWVHDAWISLLANATGARGVIIEEPLIKYRQHPRQVLGGIKLSFVDQVRQALSIKGEEYKYEQIKFHQVLNRLILLGMVNRDAKNLIQAKIKHLEARQSLYECAALKSVKTILQELLTCRYHKFSNGWKSLGKDLFIVIKKSDGTSSPWPFPRQHQ